MQWKLLVLQMWLVGVQVGGHWLSWWMVAAAAISQIGQFEAEMSSDSFQLLGMAERGFLPKALAKRSKHDTPTVLCQGCYCSVNSGGGNPQAALQSG